MRSHTRRLLIALLGALAVTAATPVATGAAAEPGTVLPQAAAEPTVTSSMDIVNVALHHNGDPRQGTVLLTLSIQHTSCSSRTFASLTKVNKALRVQIDAVYFSADGYQDTQDTTPVSSGAANTVSKATPCAASAPDTGYWIIGQSGSVRFSVRWSDGTVTGGTWSTGSNSEFSNTGYPEGPYRDPRLADAAGSTIVQHYGDARLGSVKIDAGMRLYRTTDSIWAIQPYATITKVGKAQRVQIDTLEAIGSTKYYPQGTPTRAWPSNPTVRSSGAGSSASLSTAITRVNPLQNADLWTFQVAVYYSVRWDDGTLSTGRWLSPKSGLAYSFPGGQW